MDEQRERCLAGSWCRKQIDELAWAFPVAQAELGAPLLHRLRPILFGLPGPSGKDLRMVGHPGAVVVFSLVVDGHAAVPLPASLSFPSTGWERCAGVARVPEQLFAFAEIAAI